jgi:hypothetical protein
MIALALVVVVELGDEDADVGLVDVGECSWFRW